jgi:hypothetical protein
MSCAKQFMFSSAAIGAGTGNLIVRPGVWICALGLVICRYIF